MRRAAAQPPVRRDTMHCVSTTHGTPQHADPKGHALKPFYISKMKDIRNIAILAHIDAGKTTLSERILWTTGKILRAGNVEDGLATMDYLFEEKAKGITIEAGISNFEWRNIWWNLIDAPGHIDFGVEADSALEAADAAILVISTVDGIQPQTVAAWEKLKSLKKPCIIFFNKTDLPEARLEESFWEIEEQFGRIPVLLSWTDGEGVWDILSGAYLKNAISNFILIACI